MDYDQNLTMCGRMATQSIRLTFASGNYRRGVIVETEGNQMGLDAIAQAVSWVYDSLEGRPLELTDGEDTLFCDDDYDMGAEWLSGFLIGAEILSISSLDDATTTDGKQS